MPDRSPGTESEEVSDRVQIRWYMEKLMPGPPPSYDPSAVEDAEPPKEHWMGIGSIRDDRDDMLKVLAFHRSKYPDDQQRIVRMETRHFMEEIDEETGTQEQTE